MTTIIYVIETPLDSEKFVKATKNKDLRKRKHYYKRSLRKNSSNTLSKKMKKFGFKNYTFRILEKVMDDKAKVKLKINKWIMFFFLNEIKLVG